MFARGWNRLRCSSATAVLGALYLAPSLAFGHAGDLLDSIDVRPPTTADPSALVESTIGLLWAENGTDYRWICHEAVTRTGSVMTPRYHRSSAGFTLAVVPRLGEGRESGETLYRSEDHCDWATVSGLSGQTVVDLTLQPNSPSTAFAVTTSSESVQESGVWKTQDGGKTWQLTNLVSTEKDFSAIHATSSALWATSLNGTSRQAWLHHSEDGGKTWQEWQVDLANYSTPLGIDILDVTDAGIWFRAKQTLKDDLWHLDPSEASATRVLEGQTKLMSMTTTTSGNAYVSVWNEGIAELRDGKLVLTPDSPRSYTVRASGDELYAATRHLFTGQALMRASNQRDFEPLLSYSDVKAYPTCAPESHSAAHCEPLWATLSARLATSDLVQEDTGDLIDLDTGAEEPQTGCFGSGPKRSILFAFLPLGFLRRGQGRGKQTR